MDHLLENYKTDCCRLDLPEGLRELMSDISREVLRAQPLDICRFIAEYLSALLVTRDHLAVASQLCDYLCECECHPELLHELVDLGLDLADAEIAEEIIMKHFKKENVNEGNILAALLAKTNIEASMYPNIVVAVRAAFARHQTHVATTYEKPSKDKSDEVAAAAAHTLDLYRNAGPTDDLCGGMATKIQASYRAYGVRREFAPKTVQPKDPSPVMSELEPEKSVVPSDRTTISDYIMEETSYRSIDLQPVMNEPEPEGVAVPSHRTSIFADMREEASYRSINPRPDMSELEPEDVSDPSHKTSISDDIREEASYQSINPRPDMNEPEPEAVAVSSHRTSISDDIREEIELTARMHKKKNLNSSS